MRGQAKTLTIAIRNKGEKCEHPRQSEDRLANAVGTFVGTLLQNGGYFWVVPTLRLVWSIAVTT